MPPTAAETITAVLELEGVGGETQVLLSSEMILPFLQPVQVKPKSDMFCTQQEQSGITEMHSTQVLFETMRVLSHWWQVAPLKPSFTHETQSPIIEQSRQERPSRLA